MTSELLPGFRTIRTPLATGYLYLGLLWLWVGALIPTEPDRRRTGRSRL